MKIVLDTSVNNPYTAPDMNNIAHNGFKKGDRVRATKTGKEYTFVEYQDTFTAKLENDRLEVFSFNRDEIELVVPVSETPRTDKVFADIGENILDHAQQLETELDAAKGIAEALEEEVAELKSTLKEVRKEARNEIDNYQNIVGRLHEELARLRRWKEQDIRVESQWDPQEVGKELGMVVGTDIRPNILPKVRELKELAESYRIERESLIRECNNWQDTAAQHLRNEQYYRDLLVQCGQAIGKEAYICDDGTAQQDVLVAKVPELVRRLVAGRAAPKTTSFAFVPVKNPHEDFAQQAKELLQNIHGFNDTVTSNAIDNFVDLIIKAAKQ